MWKAQCSAGDTQAVIALVERENEPITHASQIDEAKPVGDRYRRVVHYNVAKDQVTVECRCARREAVARCVFKDSVRFSGTEWNLRRHRGRDDNIRVEPAGSCV